MRDLRFECCVALTGRRGGEGRVGEEMGEVVGFGEVERVAGAAAALGAVIDAARFCRVAKLRAGKVGGIEEVGELVVKAGAKVGEGGHLVVEYVEGVVDGHCEWVLHHNIMVVGLYSL